MVASCHSRQDHSPDAAMPAGCSSIRPGALLRIEFAKFQSYCNLNKQFCASFRWSTAVRMIWSFDHKSSSITSCLDQSRNLIIWWSDRFTFGWYDVVSNWSDSIIFKISQNLNWLRSGQFCLGTVLRKCSLRLLPVQPKDVDDDFYKLICDPGTVRSVSTAMFQPPSRDPVWWLFRVWFKAAESLLTFSFVVRGSWKQIW